MKQTYQAHLALLTTTLIFGLHYTVAKSLMPSSFQPMQILFLRLLGAVVIFCSFQKFFIREKVARKDLYILAICGVVGFALNQCLFYEGLNLTTPVDASLIHVLTPVCVLIFASLVIREKVTWTKVGGIVLGATGALILILYGRAVSMSSNSFAGNILIVLNMLCYAIYLVMIKPLVGKYHTITILKWVSLFGLLFIIPFSVKGLFAFHPVAVSTTGWIGLGYIILFCTFIAYLLINFALKHMEASMVSFYTYLQPIIASVSSVSLGAETITFPKIIAAALIFVGVFLVNRRGKDKSVQLE